MPPFPPQGTPGAHAKASNGYRSNQSSGSCSSTSAAAGSSSGRSESGEQSRHGTGAGVHHATPDPNGGERQPAWMNADGPYTDPNAFRSMGGGSELIQVDALGRQYTVVRMPPPNQQQAFAGGSAPVRGLQGPPSHNAGQTARSQSVRSGQHNGGYTHNEQPCQQVATGGYALVACSQYPQSYIPGVNGASLAPPYTYNNSPQQPRGPHHPYAGRSVPPRSQGDRRSGH